MPHPSAHSPSLTEAVLTLLLIGLAAWTLTVHGLVLADGNFHDLQHLAWLAILPVYPLYRLIHAVPVTTPPPQEPRPAPCDWSGFAMAVVLVAIFEWSTPYFPNSRLHVFWLLSSCFLGWNWLMQRDDTEIGLRPLPMTRQEGMILGLLIIGVLLVTLCAHRPDPDDQYYTNLAVTAMDHPERPLLSWNGIIQGAEHAAWLPVDRLPSHEMLVALAAHWLGMEPIAVSHLLFAPFFAVMTVLAQALLLRHLAPQAWLTALLVEIFLLLSLGGETRAGFAVFSFVQIHFGKSVLFSALLPLLLLYGLRFGQTGSRRDWLLLFCGQIAAVGLSTSGLFLAPVAAGLGLTANWRPDWTATRRLAVGIAASLYPLAVGALLARAMSASMATMGWEPLSVMNNFSKVFGEGTHQWFYLLTLIGAWSLMRDAGQRRTMLGLSLVFTAIFLNPFLYPLFSQHLTGAITTWRLNFTIPLPAMAALMTLALAGARERDGTMPAPWPLFMLLVVLLLLSFAPQWRGFWGIPLSIAVAAGGIVLAWRRLPGPWFALLILAVLLASLTHLSFPPSGKRTPLASPRTRMAWPGIKASQPEFSVAQRVVALAPTGKSALTPIHISTWVATLRHHPRLVTITNAYLEQVANSLEPNALQHRATLDDYLSGTRRAEDAATLFQEAIDFYDVGIVAVRQNTPWLPEIDALLTTHGFRQSQSEKYLFWVRHDNNLTPR
ncbi:MAG: hypothetical protein HQM03_06730 [Magnetococcales bacterium]|nr:hypothetical protein [Magnetococcales bacterium]